MDARDIHLFRLFRYILLVNFQFKKCLNFFEIFLRKGIIKKFKKHSTSASVYHIAGVLQYGTFQQNTTGRIIKATTTATPWKTSV